MPHLPGGIQAGNDQVERVGAGEPAGRVGVGKIAGERPQHKQLRQRAAAETEDRQQHGRRAVSAHQPGGGIPHRADAHHGQVILVNPHAQYAGQPPPQAGANNAAAAAQPKPQPQQDQPVAGQGGVGKHTDGQHRVQQRQYGRRHGAGLHGDAALFGAGDAPGDLLGQQALQRKAGQPPKPHVLERRRQQGAERLKKQRQQRDGIGIEHAGAVGVDGVVAHAQVGQPQLAAAVKLPAQVMLGGVRPAVQDPVGVGHVQHPHAVQRQKECHACQRPGQCKGIAVRSAAYRTDRPACRSRMRRIHRSKVVDMVVDQLSPCFRLTAQGRFSHSSGPFSSPGRLCHGSMQTKRAGQSGCDQIST